MRLSREKAFLDVKEREKVPKGDMNNCFEKTVFHAKTRRREKD